MKNRKGMELAMTTIIVIIILIVTLLAILLFFQGKFTELSIEVGKLVTDSGSSYDKSLFDYTKV